MWIYPSPSWADEKVRMEQTVFGAFDPSVYAWHCALSGNGNDPSCLALLEFGYIQLVQRNYASTTLVEFKYDLDEYYGKTAAIPDGASVLLISDKLDFQTPPSWAVDQYEQMYSLRTALLTYGAGRAPTALHQAAMRNHEVAELLLQSGVNPNTTNSWMVTALMFGLREERHLEFVKLLIDYGIDLNITDYNRKTALWYASTLVSGPELVRLLMKHGANPMCPESDETAFLASAECGHLEIVEMLMEYVEDSAISPRDFSLLLCRSCRSQRKEHAPIILQLLRRGKAVIPTNYPEILEAAVSGGHYAVVQYIFELDTDTAVPTEVFSRALLHAKS
ncbi:hypothetical protein Poli38472_001930 [Pythium oligandrum]|uniref:Ankyrin repeat protein n=1 Tax=Pythium oligandrum TaxID=41045 RepID=A0A8K1CUI0_PYTOL|nr:hypothetical protein Poli38472_001930 [Pythium oligandrum]|eukprot:TMW69774.1 hypothetical protein Poli38472_001930 [Pythium oligandrum]